MSNNAMIKVSKRMQVVEETLTYIKLAKERDTYVFVRDIQKIRDCGDHCLLFMANDREPVVQIDMSFEDLSKLLGAEVLNGAS